MFYGVYLEKVSLEKGLVNFFCKIINSKIFSFCGFIVCGSYFVVCNKVVIDNT